MAKDVAVLNAKLPAHLQGAANAIDEFAGGVQSGFPVISYRGRVWRVKISGEEQAYTDANGDAVPSVELVLLRSNPRPSKIHYDKKYEEGDDGKPRCWSPDGVKPDAEVENPISPTCAGCPNNAWGSRITENGKKSRACSDVRRMAVATLSDLLKGMEDENHKVTPMLLRVPPASLNPLKDYAAKVLGPKGIQPYMLVTRVGFDNEADYPKLTFKPARFLTEEEYATVLALRDSDETGQILNSTAEYSSGETTDGGDEIAGTPPTGAAATEAKSASPESSKPKPAAAAKPAAAKPAAAKPAAKPKQRAATAAEAEAAAAAATVATEPDDDNPVPTTASDDGDAGDEETTTAGGDDDIDAMLKNILGD